MPPPIDSRSNLCAAHRDAVHSKGCAASLRCSARPGNGWEKRAFEIPIPFKGFGDSALNYEVVYTVLVADYDLFMDLQQMINLQLVRELKKLDVEFAFPTRTVHLAGPAQASQRTL